MDGAYKVALTKTVSNALCSIFYIVGGAIVGSWWLLTVGVYYYILGVLRFMIVRIKKHENMLTRFTINKLVGVFKFTNCVAHFF